MRKTFITLTALFLLHLPLSAQPPDTLWTRTLGGTGNDEGYSVQQTTDGGYIIAGRTMSYGAGGSDVYLIRTDASGSEEWSQTFGGSASDYGQSVQLTSDGGYIIAGYTSSYGAGSSDVYLIKTNANGDSLWTRTFGGSSSDKGYSVQQTTDGGYIIVGRTTSFGAGDYDAYLIKTDGSGNELWTRTIGGEDYDEGFSVQQTTDGGYIIAGNTGSYGAGGSDFYLVKTNESGIELWSQTFGGSFTDYCYCVQQTQDGGYIIAGYTDSFGAGGADVYLVKTDGSGMEQWSQTFGGSNWEAGNCVQQTQDGGYITAGYTESYGAGDIDVYLIKTNASGSEEWTQTFGGSSADEGYSIQQTQDGGYIIAGKTTSFGAGGLDVYLIRLAGDGTTNDVTITLTPAAPPIIIPEAGGSFDFNIAIENVSSQAQTFDIWTQIECPNTSTVEVMNVPNFTLPAGGNPNRDRTQDVPANAPGGEYIYYGYVGVYPWEVWNMDSFTFEKEGTTDGFIGDASDWTCFGEAFESDDLSEADVSPYSFTLTPPYPNPFNPQATLEYRLDRNGYVSLIVYDVNGRETASIVDGFRNAGSYKVEFDGSSLPSGIYFARLTSNGQHQTRKLVLMK